MSGETGLKLACGDCIRWNLVYKSCKISGKDKKFYDICDIQHESGRVVFSSEKKRLQGLKLKRDFGQGFNQKEKFIIDD